MGHVNRAVFSGRNKKSQKISRGAKGVMALSAAATAAAASQSAWGASASWVATPTDANWSTGTNWTPARGARRDVGDDQRGYRDV